MSRTERLFAGLGRFSVRYRWLVIVAWLVLAVGTSSLLPSLGSEVNNDNSQFLPASAPSNVAAKLAAPLFGGVLGSSSTVDIVAVTVGPGGAGSSGGPLTAADLAQVNALAAQAARAPGVSGSRLGGFSPDRASAQVLVDLNVPPSDIAAQKPVVGRLTSEVAKFNASPLASRLGLQFHLAGSVATNVANQAVSNKTGSQVQEFSLLFIVVLLLVIFRSLLAPLITLAPAGFALVVSMSLIGELGAHGLKVSEITQLLLIVLILGAGTDYGLFLVFRTREELRSGLGQREAVARAMARVGESITASAATVVFALLSLLLASFGLYHDLGVPLAVGVAVMLLAGLTLLPALLAVFGRAAFWPSFGPRRASRDDGAEGLWGRVAARFVARPALTLAGGVVVFVALAAAALGYHSSGFGGVLSAPKGSDEAAGNAVLARHFPSASANPANLVFRYPKPVWSDAGPLQQAQASLEGSKLFAQLVSPLDPNGTPLTASQLESLHRRLGAPADMKLPEPASLVASIPPQVYVAYRSVLPLVSADGRTVQFEADLVAGPQSSNAALDATPAVRRAVSAAGSASGALASGVAGEAAGLYDVSSTSGHDMLSIIPVAILAIGLLLGLLLRSVVAPLYLIVSVGLSYLAALGLSTLVFIDLGGNGGITFILPFLMFIFLLALGEDYNILVMTRIREEAHNMSLPRAVVKAVGRTGATVTSAGMVLAGTFAVLAFSAGSGPGSGQVRDVGFGLAIGVLMDTFLVRTLLVPSTVALLGRWNWWPGRLSTITDHHARGLVDLGPEGTEEPGLEEARR